MDLDQIKTSILEHKDWVFSGIGTSLAIAMGAWLWRSILRTQKPEKISPTEIGNLHKKSIGTTTITAPANKIIITQNISVNPDNSLSTKTSPLSKKHENPSATTDTTNENSNDSRSKESKKEGHGKIQVQNISEKPSPTTNSNPEPQANQFNSEVYGELLINCESQVVREIRNYVGDKYVGQIDEFSSHDLYIHRDSMEKQIDNFIHNDCDFFKTIKTCLDTIDSKKIKGIRETLKEAEHFFIHGDPKKASKKIQEVKARSKKFKLGVSFSVALNKLESLQKNVFLIKERAGSGKTNLFCNLALRYLKECRYPTIFLTCGSLQITGEESIGNEINNRIGGKTGLSDMVNQIATHGIKSPIIIFIDAINENPEIGLFPGVLKNFIETYHNTRIRIVISCRNLYWAPFEKYRWDHLVYSELENKLHRFNTKELNNAVSVYFTYYNIKTTLNDIALKKCSHPLLLRFFCETYGDPQWSGPRYVGQSIKEITNIRLKELFDDYLSRKLGEIETRSRELLYGTKHIQEYLYNIVGSMRAAKKRSIAKGDIPQITNEKDIYSLNSIYSSILDEDIILEEGLKSGFEKEEYVFFVYEEFMEYLMAREIILTEEWTSSSEKKISNDLNLFIKESRAFVNLYNVIDYLSVMINEIRGVNLWNMMTDQGIEWQTLIIESIKKVEKSNLDDQVTDTLTELYSKAKSIQIKNKTIGLLVSVGRYIPVNALEALEKIFYLEKETENKPENLKQIILSISRVKNPKTIQTLTRIEEYCSQDKDIVDIVYYAFANNIKHKKSIPFILDRYEKESNNTRRRMLISAMLNYKTDETIKVLLDELISSKDCDPIIKEMILYSSHN